MPVTQSAVHADDRVSRGQALLKGALAKEAARKAIALVPPPASIIHTEDEHLRAAGVELLRAKRVALICLAGGQGSRLGFSGPKGAFVLGGKSLFEWHTLKIQRDSQGLSVPIPPLLVMTSRSTHEATLELFSKNGNFGLPSVEFFQQGELPALTCAEPHAPIPDSSSPSVLLRMCFSPCVGLVHGSGWKWRNVRSLASH